MVGRLWFVSPEDAYVVSYFWGGAEARSVRLALEFQERQRPYDVNEVTGADHVTGLALDERNRAASRGRLAANLPRLRPGAKILSGPDRDARPLGVTTFGGTIASAVAGYLPGLCRLLSSRRHHARADTSQQDAVK